MKRARLISLPISLLTITLYASMWTGAVKPDARTEMLIALDSFKVALDDQWSYRYANNADYHKPIQMLREKITKGMSMDEFGVGVEKILALGIDGHSRIRGYTWPAGACLPFMLEAHGDRFVAFNVDRKTFLIDGFPILAKIDGKPIKDWYERAAERVPKGSPHWMRHRSIVRFMGRLDYWRTEFSLPQKDTVTVELTNASGKEFRTLNIAVARTPASYPTWPDQNSKLLPGNIGYLRLRNMEAKPSTNEILAWMPNFRDADGLVIDVRDNDGGDRDALHLLYSYLTPPGARPRVFNAVAYRLHPSRNEDYLSGYTKVKGDPEKMDAETGAAVKEFLNKFKPAWQLPKGQFSEWHYAMLRRNANHDIYHFDKPVVILMNAKCFSATDIFLAGLKGLKNVTLLGTPSGGGSGNSRTVKLGTTPIELTISSMASFQSNGKLFDGNGVHPDIILQPTLEYYIGRSDNVLDRAIRIVKSRKK